MKPLVLHITGMSCGHCLNAVSSALGQLPGVVSRSVTDWPGGVGVRPDQVSAGDDLRRRDGGRLRASPLAAGSWHDS